MALATWTQWPLRESLWVLCVLEYPYCPKPIPNMSVVTESTQFFKSSRMPFLRFSHLLGGLVRSHWWYTRIAQLLPVWFLAHLCALFSCANMCSCVLFLFVNTCSV